MNTPDVEKRQGEPDEVVEALVMVSRVMVAISIRALSHVDSDITLQQFRTMVNLVPGPQRITDLGNILGLQSSAATRMCARLVRRGLLAREERADDRRAAWVSLTPSGRDLIRAGMQQRRLEIAHHLRGLPIDDPAGLVKTLETFAQRAGEIPNGDWTGRLDRGQAS